MKTYNEKKKIADAYLFCVCGLGWDDLADINSLHDCEDKEDIVWCCQDRLEDSGFPADLLD